MKKKILASLLAIVTVFACIAFTACDSDKTNYSETYEGTLSTESFTSPVNAAEAFIANEIDSEASHATFQSYTKTADLTEGEIAKLSLTEEQIADVKSAEKGVIYYTKATPSTATLPYAVEDPDLKSQTIYIIEFNTSSVGGSVKYLAPLPKVGEAVTKSYLESVFNLEDYKNCTQTYEMPITVKLSQGGQSATMKINTKATARITETAVEMVVTATASMMGISETKTVKSYLVDSPNGILQATLNDGYWDVTNYTYQTGVEKIADMFASNLPDADYSYLVKTKTGFKISDEYLSTLMDDLLSDAGVGDYYDNGFNISMSAEYFVSQGRLDNVQVSLKMTGSMEGMSSTITIKAKNTFSNFGTTKVTVPAGAKDALGI